MIKRFLLFVWPVVTALVAAIFVVVSPGRPGYSQVPKASLLVGAPFRISQTSAAGADRAAASPDSAYNRDDNEYLVVWEGNGLSGAGSQGAREIFGQRINAATGAETGADFRISNTTDQGKGLSAGSPQVVYNSTAHEYLVVWNGTGLISAPDKFFEIYGQRLSRTGAEIGTDFRISHTTDKGKVNTSFVRASTTPDVAWNSVDNQYLVVWSGMGQPEDVVKLEIYGQLLTSMGEEIGKDFRISDTTDQGLDIHASATKVAYNSKNNQFLIVWSGGFKDASRTEIWGQGLNAKGGLLGKGKGDFRISQMSESATGGSRSAGSPDVIYNSSNNEYFIVFQARGLTDESQNGVSGIYGQRIDGAKLLEIGPQDFPITNTAGAGTQATKPRVAYNNLDQEYLVLWRGARAGAPNEFFGRRLSATGTEIDKDFQVTNIAAVGKDRTVNAASLTSNSTGGEYLAVWQGNGLPGAAHKGVVEIFGQRMKIPAKRR